MLYKCYGNNKNNNVTVDSRWLVFEYFYNDIPRIEGYDKNMYDNGLLELDKDIKQRYSKNKIYSIETCIFVKKDVNSRIQNLQQKTFKAISPSGEIFYDDNISKFAREHDLERKQISAVLHKRYKSTKDWKFYYVVEDIV